jgi:hypothetical protein
LGTPVREYLNDAQGFMHKLNPVKHARFHQWYNIGRKHSILKNSYSRGVKKYILSRKNLSGKSK